MVLLPSPSERKKLRHLRRRWGVAKSGQIAPQGTVSQWEHWDGSVDADVHLAPFRIRIRQDRDPAPLIAELEAAVRAHEQAGPLGRGQAARRVAQAKKALQGR